MVVRVSYPPIATRSPLLVPLLMALATLAACAPFQHGLPGVPAGAGPAVTGAPTAGPGEAVLQAARSRIGAPYRYGGAGPDAFDCSGLVAYAHRELGVAVPRTAAQQFAAAMPVPRSDLQPGDLVFFRLENRQVSHVGIYAGDNRFVHAPQSGGHVRMASLDDDYFRNRYAGAGRLHSATP